MADLPELQLTYGYSPAEGVPGGPNVIVTTDPQVVVASELSFLIRNPADHPVINFDNPDGLTPDSELPPINARDWPTPVDRLYLRFPWCTAESPTQCRGYLTTPEYADGINVSPAPEIADQWYTNKMTSPDVGVYWILFPKDKSVRLDANQSIRFIISNIVTYIPDGSVTDTYIKPDVAGYANTEKVVAPVYLTNPPPIITFAADSSNLTAGETTKLKWTSVNAKAAQLEPIDGGVADVPTNDANGYDVRPLETTTYTLTATSPIGKVSRKSVTINLAPVKIDGFTATPASSVRLGDAVQLAWTTRSAVKVVLSPPASEVCSNATGCNSGCTTVTPGQYTTYRLTASGQGPADSRTVVVFPIPVGWNQYAQNLKWLTRMRPVLLAYKPERSDVCEFWFIAGGTTDSDNFVFRSLDGESWAPATRHAAFGKRGNAGGVVFQNKMWLMGGVDENDTALNDIWTSVDGATWEQVTVTGDQWSERSGFSCVIFQDKIWVIGGFDDAGNPLGDVWSSADGITWQQETASPGWSPRGAASVTVFENALWILGGQLGKAASDATNEVWQSTDGVTWHRKVNGNWTPRAWLTTQAINGTLYMVGGVDRSGTGTNTFATMDAHGNWTAGPGASWDKLRYTAALNYQDAIWFAGGQNNDGSANQTLWLFAPSLN